MDLRGFAKNKKRTWYNTRKLSRSDKLTILFTLTVFTLSLMVTIFINGSRFWNPFV
jgi:energy-coupling factor transport system permease protein